MGLLLQGLGAERVESLCDAFDEEVKAVCKEHGKETRFRYSPGYGDWPLEVQRRLFELLDAPRKVGVSLTDSLLMVPSKSVSAIIGVKTEVSQ